MIPSIPKPSILDIGCGSGVPTIELAKLSDGQITAIDVDQVLLGMLQRESIQSGFDDNIMASEMSIHNITFESNSFDIVWSEGSIYVIGFENGLKDWRLLLKTNGFLVIHDELKDVSKKLNLVAKYGYQLHGQIVVDSESWWTEYYEPLQESIKCPEMVSSKIRAIEREIETFKKNPIGSIFFVMQKG
jgi:ubiquinone/menaquinone biosynthesis C-methylase UbiE